MATLLDELSQLISALDENEIEYALCGGLALTIHGFPRATFDIDILIQPESLEKGYEVAAQFGYDIRGLDMSFKERDESEKGIGREKEKRRKGERRKPFMSEEKSIVWRRFEAIGAGHEFARVFSERSKHFLEGTAIFVDQKKFCKLDYKIECDEIWKTLNAKVSGFAGDEKIEIEIAADSNKIWTMNGEEISAVQNCIDVDLNFSPVTNTLPIRRLNLEIGAKAKVRAAWLRFPSFKLEVLEQIYERNGENRYAYESAGGKFRTEIETDEFGLATSYGDFWKAEK